MSAVSSSKRPREAFSGAPPAKRAKVTETFYPRVEFDWRTFDFKRLHVQDFVPYKLAGSGGYVQVLYKRPETDELVIPVFETPRMRVPFTVEEKQNPKDDLDLALQFEHWNDEDPAAIPKEEHLFHGFLKQWDEWVVGHLEKHKKEWFPTNKNTKEAAFVAFAKRDVVRQQENTKDGGLYPPNFRVMLPKGKMEGTKDY